MVIRELRMKNFGRFCYKNISLQKGINIVYGANESGKTTTHSFIKSMLFGMDGQHVYTKDANLFEKYKPWGREYDFSGSMKVEDEDNTYTITRKFLNDSEQTDCINETTGENDCIEVFSKLDSNGFKNLLDNDVTGSRNRNDLATEVKKYITNFATSNNKEIDVEKSLKVLQEKKKQINLLVTSERVSELRDKIELDNKDEDRLNALLLKERELSKQLEKAPTAKEAESIRIIKEYVDKFDTIKEEYKNYQELIDQRKLMINIDARLDKPDKTAHRKFPIFMIAVTLIAIFIVFLFMDIGPVSICASVGIVFLSGAVMYLCNDRVTEFLVTRECERQLADEQYARESIDQLNAQIVEKQRAILEYANRVYSMNEVNNEEMFKLEQEIAVLKNQVEGFVFRGDKSEQGVRLELDRVKWEIERLSTDSRLRKERKKQYKELATKLEEEEREIESIELAITYIERISSELSGGFEELLSPIISKYCELLTDDKYSSVVIDDKFDIMVLENDRYVSIDSLSTGTVEQIFLAIKLAIIDMVDNKKKLPIILDDTFVCYDDNRLQCTLKALSDIKDRQIIIFTCQKREHNILKEQMIPFSLIEL